DVHLVRGFVDLVDVDCFFNRTMIATLSGPQLLLMRELLCEWLVNLATAFIVGVAPQTAIAVTVVAPAGIVNDRIKAQRFKLNTRSRSRAYLLTDVAQPCWARVALDAGLSDEDWSAITLINFTQHVANRPVQRMRRRQQHVLTTARCRRVRILVNPLIVRVIVDAE